MTFSSQVDLRDGDPMAFVTFYHDVQKNVLSNAQIKDGEALSEWEPPMLVSEEAPSEDDWRALLASDTSETWIAIACDIPAAQLKPLANLLSRAKNVFGQSRSLFGLGRRRSSWGMGGVWVWQLSTGTPGWQWAEFVHIFRRIPNSSESVDKFLSNVRWQNLPHEVGAAPRPTSGRGATSLSRLSERHHLTRIYDILVAQIYRTSVSYRAEFLSNFLPRQAAVPSRRSRTSPSEQLLPC